VLDAEGYFDTGDVATFDAQGYMQITDRAKDIVKSGGEWISSVDLENALMAHPAVLEAAVIGVPDLKFTERPLGVVVLKDGQHADTPSLNAFLTGKFAKFQLPDRYEFVPEIPKTSTGKFQKTRLREMFPK